MAHLSPPMATCQSEVTQVRAAQQNRLIRALPAAEQDQLTDQLETVHLAAGQILNQPDERVHQVYFPYDAVASVLVTMHDGTAIEGAVVGNQGMIGLGVFLGSQTAVDEVDVQIAGLAGRMPTASFRSLAFKSQSLQHLLHRYALALIHDLARTAGCNQLHSVRQRLARRLLLGRDLVGHTGYAATHESLANLLGVRRASVSEVAEEFLAQGVIRYRRGWVEILDPAGLERAACTDYRFCKDRYDEIFPDRCD